MVKPSSPFYRFGFDGKPFSDAPVRSQPPRPPSGPTINQWGPGSFGREIVKLAIAGRYLTAAEIPESIDLDLVGRSARRLSEMTRATGLEHARTFQVDCYRKSMIASNRISRGTDHSAKFIWTEPHADFMGDRYRKVGHVHSHPIDATVLLDLSALHISGRDFQSFLSDPQNIFMAIVCNGTTMLVMKTVTTPRLETAEIKQRIDSIENDYLSGEITLPEVVAFTKQVCVEFMLVMFMATQGNSVATRISVTD